jgi:carbon monoxide dehydrogenase subunit G
MVRFEGDRDFTQPPAEVWAKLTDPRFLVVCIPDVQTVKSVSEDHAELVLRPGLGFVKGTLDVSLKVRDAVAPTSARMEIFGKGIGSSSDVEATLALTPQGRRGAFRIRVVVENKGNERWGRRLACRGQAGRLSHQSENKGNERWGRRLACRGQAGRLSHQSRPTTYHKAMAKY